MASATEPINPSLVSELNVMHYVELLKRRWLWMVVCGILGAGIAFLWAFTTPPTYAARTELAIIRTGAIVNFDPRFRTVSETDPNAQRRLLVTIGDSPAFTEQVIQKIGNQLPDYLRTPEALQEVLSVISDGDVIRVSVNTESPELSALISNTWAEAYVARVNQVFGDSGLDNESLQKQALELKKDYEIKQAAVVSDIASETTHRLLRERDIIERQMSVDLESKLIRLLADATALRELIANGNGDVTSSQEFALFMVQASSFTSSGDTPFRVDVPITADLTPRTRPELLRELDLLIANLEERRAALGGETRDESYRRLRALNVEIEGAQAVRKDLEAARDLAWNTYLLLNQKVTENRVATEAESQLVQIASPAIVPTRPIGRQTLLKTVLGGMVGLVIGATLALVLKPR